MNNRPLKNLAMRALIAIAACAATGAAFAQTQDPKAILAAMSKYVGAQQTIEVKFDSELEVITPEMEKLQFTSSGDSRLHRPDKLRTHRVGGYSDVTLYFDGKTVNIYGENVNSYARFDSPGTTDQLISALRSGRGIALPGADLLLTNSYDVLAADIMEAKYVGRGIVDGVECEHLAFRNFDTDWQLWVEAGAHPIPRKLVITSKTVNGAPQYTLRIRHWKTGVALSPSLFTFTPPAGATRLELEALADLDELPPSAPPGGAK